MERYLPYRKLFYEKNEGDIERIGRVEIREDSAYGKKGLFWILGIIISFSLIIIISLWTEGLFAPLKIQYIIDKKETPREEGIEEERLQEIEEIGEGEKVSINTTSSERGTESEGEIQGEEEQQILTIEALERTWILVQIDDSENKDVLLQEGERVTWKAHKNFLLTIGNAGGVKVFFNKKELDPFGESGEVVKNIFLSKE